MVPESCKLDCITDLTEGHPFQQPMAKDPEAKALARAQQNMDRLFEEANLLPTRDDDQDDWTPAPIESHERASWENTLARIDLIQTRSETGTKNGTSPQ